jgi:hypothetical protein
MKPTNLLFGKRWLASAAVLLAATTAGAAPLDLVPEWSARLPLGRALTAGIAGFAVDTAGNSYVTGISGSESNTDITTAAFGPDGSLLWSRTFNGPANGHDQARGITIGPGGVLYVTGNTPDPLFYAKVLLLAYDAATGDLLNTIQYSSGPGTSEFGGAVATDAGGNVYVVGGTVGDGGDALILAFDTQGQLLWRKRWDGQADGPYSQDSAFQVLVDPAGNPIVLIHGVMASLHPDYVVVKYAARDGAILWEATWGVSGEDSPSDMAIDAAGDIYVTGTGIDLIDKFSTIKLRGADGRLLWQAYDTAGHDDRGTAVSIDGKGGVLITGTVDPDGDRSTFNDNIYTVKRDAESGAQIWTHLYGLDCHGCYDVAADVVPDQAGHVFVAGSTSSPPYNGDGILLVLDNKTGTEIDRGIIAGGANENVSPAELRLDRGSNVLVSGNSYDLNSADVNMSVTKFTSVAGIPCGDALRFLTRCVDAGDAGNKLGIRLVFTDDRHDGEQVTFTVDGRSRDFIVRGRRAQAMLSGAPPGPHTVELTDPAGCFPVQTPVCPH